MYQLIFRGRPLEGHSADDIRPKVQKIFNAGDEKMAQLFSGKPVVIKNHCDKATALKYKKVFEQAGAELIIRQPNSDSTNETASEQPPAKPEPVDYGDVPPPPQTTPIATMPSEELNASIRPIDGSYLVDEAPEPEPFDMSDVEGISLAPVGSDLGVEKHEDLPPPPDTSGLTLKD